VSSVEAGRNASAFAEKEATINAPIKTDDPVQWAKQGLEG